jgi:hypothetical protein
MPVMGVMGVMGVTIVCPRTIIPEHGAGMVAMASDKDQSEDLIQSEVAPSRLPERSVNPYFKNNSPLRLEYLINNLTCCLLDKRFRLID